MPEEYSFDHVLDDIAGAGRYQILLVLFVSYVSIPSAFMMTGSVFYASSPDSRCTIQPFDNHSLYPDITSEDITETFIPWNVVTQNYDRCKRKVYNTTIFHKSTLNLSDFRNETEYEIATCSDGYTYDFSTFKSTIVTEWNLVCGRSIYSAIHASIFYFGIFLGSVIGGILADKFGRVFIFRCSVLLPVIGGCCVYFAPNIIVLTIIQFIIALIYFQGIVAGFTYAAEISPKKWRMYAAFGYNSAFGLGSMLLSVVAYFCREWRTFLVVTIAFGFLPAVILSWLITKSPRWLLAQGKFKEARQSCEKIAQKNDTTLSEELWKASVQYYSINQADVIEAKQNDNKVSLFQIVLRPCTRYLILSNMFVWMVTSMVYYGLILNSGALAGNIYINNALGGLMETVAVISAIPLVKYIGCTKTTAYALFAASFTCLISTAITYIGYGISGLKIFATILAMMGRYGTSLAFGTIYLHTVEMFPTSGRTTALGLSSMAARVGSLFSPFTVQFQHTMPWVTPVIFGISALLAGCVSTTFPDTREKELTNTFKEAESQFKKHFKKSLISRLFVNSNKRETDEDNAEEMLFQNEEKI